MKREIKRKDFIDWNHYIIMAGSHGVRLSAEVNLEIPEVKYIVIDRNSKRVKYDDLDTAIVCYNKLL